MKELKNIAVFASGSGTNAENLAMHFKDSEVARVTTILVNRPDAYVLERAKKLQIPTFLFDRSMFRETGEVLKYLEEKSIDMIVLAGFLWLIPQNIINKFRGRIINIHPALLPKHGGKGMYGEKVHQAVIDDGDKESGITIHHVNEKYDEGNIIFQEKCPVESEDTPESVAQKVHKLEYKHYPRVIEKLIISQ